MNFDEYLRERIHRHGPLTFRDYMDAVLYHPDFGYYSSTRPRIGSDGDFYTSSDLDPIFGTLLARQFEAWSKEIPDFTVLELGAGKGLLARDILTCHRFTYRILERSVSMRAQQRSNLDEFGVEWVDELPPEMNGVIFSNEFFDALPVHRFVGRAGTVKELFVDESLSEVEAEPSVAVDFTLREGQIADVGFDARGWMRQIAGSLKQGYHLAVDYGYLRDEFFAQPRGTLMCYRRHQAHENPFLHPGDQDITAHVNFSDLIDEGRKYGLDAVRLATQKDFLVDLGILIEMQQLAEAGDSRSMQRLLRIKNLIVPDRMGSRFKVLVQRTRISGQT